MLVPAKINLYLHVTGKRPDGYHLLDSLIVFTDICDEITVEESNQFSLNISGEFAHLVEKNERNIVTSAANIMAEECKMNLNIAINLVKNIPVGAGLGGGSADCASTILLLNNLWKAALPQEKLMEIGIKLGADVPVFIGRKAAFISGIGEHLQPLDTLPELYAILVYPNKPLSTKDVFSAIIPTQKFSSKESPSTNLPTLGNEKNVGKVLSLINQQRNNLEDAAISLLPEIREILEELSDLEGCELARMSGSGSTCFAIFKDRNQAESHIHQITQKHPGYWVKLCKLRVEY